jgi:hypothetical protein
MMKKYFTDLRYSLALLIHGAESIAKLRNISQPYVWKKKNQIVTSETIVADLPASKNDNFRVANHILSAPESAWRRACGTSGTVQT